MPGYILLGKYTPEGVKGISSERTKQANELIEKLGGKFDQMYATIGDYDLVFHVQFPDNATAIKGSYELNKLTGVDFLTMPAVSIVEFDKLIAK